MRPTRVAEAGTARVPATAIRASRLGVVLGGRWVLRDVGFAVGGGRVTGLLGPSGCGKTTLMRCVVGVQELAAGRVEVLGARAGSAALRRQVGYTTQSAAVYGDLTVRANVRYFAALHGLTGRAADRAVAEVGLTPLLDRRVGTLSGGQRARASLVCALVARPRVLVLDEPTAVGLVRTAPKSWSSARPVAGVTVEPTRCCIHMVDGDDPELSPREVQRPSGPCPHRVSVWRPEAAWVAAPLVIRAGRPPGGPGGPGRPARLPWPHGPPR